MLVHHSSGLFCGEDLPDLIEVDDGSAVVAVAVPGAFAALQSLTHGGGIGVCTELGGRGVNESAHAFRMPLALWVALPRIPVKAGPPRAAMTGG